MPLPSSVDSLHLPRRRQDASLQSIDYLECSSNQYTQSLVKLLAAWIHTVIFPHQG
ncbi:hypothetical protein Enr13x_24050 [Stieleria neptunia]|uniref:Uncharacterized protein n=1 Tax=Stieleria neptunia TaxID=2527979 RepID=A0A518HP55_9BACT|nr:hypothetical protein Enr13x_24050 [Stieleria neptunia]